MSSARWRRAASGVGSIRLAGGERGQAAVELALALPLLAVLVLLVVQVGVVVRDDLLVVHAAREAARAAAVDPTGPTAHDAAARAGGLDPARITVGLARLPGRPETVRATVRYHDDTVVPLIGPLLPAVDLRASVTMAMEAGGG